MDDKGPESRLNRSSSAVPASKTAIPRLSRSHLRRPILLAALDRATEDQVILVSAPAGYGKTLLFAEWSESSPDTTAWLSLDTEDNDDGRFWSAVLGALRGCLAVPGGSALATLSPPSTPSRDAAFLASVVDALGDLPTPIRLILDDVHELTAADPLHGLAALVRDRPRGVQLALSTRSDPPLPLGRLRLTGQLCELRAGSLAFSFDEARVMFAEAAVPVRPDQVQVLLEQTDGWAAGLRLAALSMRGAEDPDLFLTDLVGNGRAISDYLISEIVSRLPPDVVEILGAVSVCDQLTAPLACALSGRVEAGDVLASLEREISLVVSYGSGRRWFRVHPLLRAHLRVELRRRRPDVLTALHRRAARWFAAADDPAAAVRHARDADDPQLLAELLRRHGVVLAASGQHGLVRTALAELRLRATSPDAALELIDAMAHMEVGDIAAVNAHIATAEASWPDPAPPELESLRALASARRGWMGEGWPAAVTGHGSTAPQPAPAATARGVDVTDLVLRANNAIALGRHAEAEELARAAADRTADGGNAYLAARIMTTLSMAAGMNGDIRRMTALASEAARAAPSDTWRTTEGEALNAVVGAYGALMEGRPEECLRVVEAATEFATALSAQRSSPGGAAMLPMVDMLRAVARFDLGERLGGLEGLRTARLATPGDVALHKPAALVAMFEYGAAARLGRADHARDVLGWAEERLHGTGELQVLRASGPAAISRHHAAREHLRPLLDGTVEPVLPWTVAEGWILECVIALRTDTRTRAREALDHALAIADEIGALRPLLVAPAEVADLIALHLGGLGESEQFARQVLVLRRHHDDGPATPLTGREQAVLALLPTLRSVEEIAEDLMVSANTVKTHVRAIYRKLGVNSRRGAVAAARHQGLIFAEPAPVPVED